MVKDRAYELMIVDQRMPEMTGVEFFAQSKFYQPDAIRILLTGYADIQSVVDAINRGEVYRYLTKPWEIDDLKNTVKQGIETFRLRQAFVQKKEELEKSNQELQLAYQELKKLDQAKTQFLALVSHELRTPLTTIVAYTESLLEGMAKNEDEANRFYQFIFDASVRLNNLVIDILDYTTIEAEKLKLNLQLEDLSAIMTNSILQLRARINEKNIHIHNRIPSITTMVDKDKIGRAFVKILDNAISFTPDLGNITLEGWIDNKQIEMVIKDDGIGIPEERLQEIFTPFATPDIYHHRKGLGLSLTICKAVIEAHGGRIWAERLFIGTAIHILLPLLEK